MAVEYDDKNILKAAYAPHAEWRSLSDSLENPDHIVEAINRVHEDQAILSQTPYSDSVETLHEITESGNEILYISSREEKCYEATALWLVQNGFPDGDLMCVQDSKIPHVRRCQFLIDDRPQTVVDFVTDYTWRRSRNTLPKENQRKAFGLWFPYNQALTDVENVYLSPNWYGLGFYMRREGLITV